MGDQVKERQHLMAQLKEIKGILGRNSIPDLRVSTQKLKELYELYKYNVECPICLEKLAPKHTKLTCGHRFHTSCYNKFVLTRASFNDILAITLGNLDYTFMFIKETAIPNCALCRAFNIPKPNFIVEFKDGQYLINFTQTFANPRAPLTQFVDDIAVLKDSPLSRGWAYKDDIGQLRVNCVHAPTELAQIEDVIDILELNSQDGPVVPPHGE